MILFIPNFLLIDSSYILNGIINIFYKAGSHMET